VRAAQEGQQFHYGAHDISPFRPASSPPLRVSPPYSDLQYTVAQQVLCAIAGAGSMCDDDDEDDDNDNDDDDDLSM